MQGSSVSQTRSSALASNKVIRNTYLLLSMTLAVSAGMAFFAMSSNAQPVHWILVLAVFIGVPFAIDALRNSVWSLPLTFAFTGFMGYVLGPILNKYLALPNGSEIVGNAMAATAVIFIGLSLYALSTRKDFSFMGGFIFVGLLVAIVAMIANIFLQMPLLSLVISGAMVLLMSAAILYDTSRMIHDGEANYVVMTVSLFANIYVLFMHLLSLFAMLTGDD